MRTWTCLLILALSLAVPANGAEPTLTGVKTERSGSSFVTELSFDTPVEPNTVKIDFINDTIQVNVPNVRVEPKRVFTKVDDQKVRSVFTYQSDKELLRTRVIYKKGTDVSQFKDSIKVSALGASLRVAVSEAPKVVVEEGASVLDPILAPKLEAGRLPPRSLDTPEIVAEIEKAAEQVVPPVVETPKESPKESEIPILSGETKAKSADAKPIRMGPVAGGLVVILLILGGVAYAFKNWYRTRAVKRPVTAIKVLAQHHLGPRKQLAIIRVAGETILIGVTDNNVNLIKTLALIDDDEIPNETPTNFAKALKKSIAAPPKSKNEDDETEEEFSLKGLREIVKNRLQRTSEHSAGDLT